MHHTRQRGLTLVEVSTTLSIAAVSAATAVGGFGELIGKRRTEGLAVEIAADLQAARTEAVLRNRAVRVTFTEDDSGLRCYVIQTGPADACECAAAPAGAPAVCDGDAVEIKTVRLADAGPVRVSANVDSMLYDPRGTVSPGATVQVTGRDGRELRHVVNLLGRVRTCAVGDWAGYRPC